MAQDRRDLLSPDKGVIGGFIPSELPIMLADDEAIGDDHGVDAYRHRAPGTDALHAVDRTASPLPCVRYGNDSGFCGLKLERGERYCECRCSNASRKRTNCESGFMKASW